MYPPKAKKTNRKTPHPAGHLPTVKHALFYEEAGEGFPLILLHGNGEDHRYFSEQIAFFSDHFRVIAPDTRGHGRSPAPDEPFSLSRLAEELKDFLDCLVIEKAHILGFSDGGNIALLFALRYPERVAGLILNGANFTPRGLKFSVALAVGTEYALLSAASLFSKKARCRRKIVGLMVGQPKLTEKELSTLRRPVLVIAGERDMIRESHTRALAAAIPGSRLAILPGDHFVAARNSTVFNRTVADFLSTISQ